MLETPTRSTEACTWCGASLTTLRSEGRKVARFCSERCRKAHYHYIYGRPSARTTAVQVPQTGLVCMMCSRTVPREDRPDRCAACGGNLFREREI